MMLSNISVYGLFGMYDYDLDVIDGHLMYIHSRNGVGKSTVMRLIYDIFNGDIERIGRIMFKRADLTFDTGTRLLVENTPDGPRVQMQRNELEETITADELRSVLDITYIGPERMYISDKNGDVSPALDIYLDQLHSDLRKAEENLTLPSPADTDRWNEMSDQELESGCKDLQANLVFMEQAGLVPEIPPNLKFPPNRYSITTSPAEYRKLAASVATYVGQHRMFAESVVVYRDVINRTFFGKTLEIGKSGRVTIRISSDGQTLSPDSLSSGEKQVMIVMYILLFRTKPGSLVLIDEPEISLHVSWQHLFGSTVKDIATMRDLHIMVSTHSPSIIHDDWDLAVELGNGI